MRERTKNLACDFLRESEATRSRSGEKQKKNRRKHFFFFHLSASQGKCGVGALFSISSFALSGTPLYRSLVLLVGSVTATKRSRAAEKHEELLAGRRFMMPFLLRWLCLFLLLQLTAPTFPLFSTPPSSQLKVFDPFGPKGIRIREEKKTERRK